MSSPIIYWFRQDLRLVDLPGYGYAKVSQGQQRHWQNEISLFLTQRAALRGLILILDIRHLPKQSDQQLLTFAHDIDLPVHTLLNKADKLSEQQSLKQLNMIKRSLLTLHPSVSLQRFSALKRQGLDELYQHLSQYWEIVE